MEKFLYYLCHLNCQLIEKKGCVSSFFDLLMCLTHSRYRSLLDEFFIQF